MYVNIIKSECITYNAYIIASMHLYTFSVTQLQAVKFWDCSGLQKHDQGRNWRTEIWDGN